MVLARRVGRPRSFWGGLALTVVTAGIYALYWNYKAHDEVYRQFELDREGREEGVVWYILGLFLFAPVFVYLWTFGSNVAYVRERLRLPRRTTGGSFVITVGAGVALYLVGVVAASAAVLSLPAEATDEEVGEAFDRAVGRFLLGLLALVVVVAFAYRRLQRDVNEVWQAYDRRIGELRVAYPPLAHRLAHPADLRPPGEI